MRRTVLVLSTLLVLGAGTGHTEHFSNVDHPAMKVLVGFTFPGGTVMVDTFSFYDLSQSFSEDLLPAGVQAHDYRIDWWVYGALQRFGLPYRVEVKDMGDFQESTITSIGEFANGPAGRWVYYVNGRKSPYFISTQMDTNLERVEYVYERE